MPLSALCNPRLFTCFFFNDTATTEIYTLSLHDALPISLEAAVEDDVLLEVEDLLQLAQRHIQELADPARQPLEEPDVGDRRGELDVAHPLAAHARPGHLDSALVADHAGELHPLVLAARALVVLRRSEDARAEQTVPLRLERPVIDRLRFLDFAMRPVADLLGRGQLDPDRVKRDGLRMPIEDAPKVLGWLVLSDQAAERPIRQHSLSPLGRPSPTLRSLLPVLRHQLDVERQTLEFLDQHVERLRRAGLEEVLALDDRLVDAVASLHVVGLHREHLLERVRGAVGFQRPHLHLAEPLAAELGLAAQRLLGHQRVRADRARVHLVVDQVGQLQYIDLPDRDFLVEAPAGASVVQDGLAGARQTRLLEVLLDLLLGGAVEHRARDPRAERARRPPEVRLEDLADVHA